MFWRRLGDEFAATLIPLSLALACGVLQPAQPAAAEEMRRERMGGDRDGMTGRDRAIGRGIGIGIDLLGGAIQDGLSKPPPRGKNEQKGKKDQKIGKTHERTTSREKKITRVHDKRTSQDRPAKPPVVVTQPPPQTPPTTTDKPPGDPPKNNPETPPPAQSGQTPPPAETGKVPSDKVTMAKAEDCPQRGKGCVALIIDMAAWNEPGIVHPGLQLSALGCDARIVQVEFKEVPPKVLRMVNGKSRLVDADPVATQKVKDHNENQRMALNDAIENHHTKVKKGVELAIEMLNGHGTEQTDRITCGRVVPPGPQDIPIDRAKFHRASYEAANGNTCGWFVADWSCYGGLTARASDELNNSGTATCKQPLENKCETHAAWEADVAVSSATSDAKCGTWTPWTQTINDATAAGSETKWLKPEDPDKPPVEQRTYRNLIQALFKIASNFDSQYTDKGYKWCQPYTRSGYGKLRPPPGIAPVK